MSAQDTALIVVDVQESFRQAPYWDASELPTYLSRQQALIDGAKAAGMPDVFAHGMLSMAYLGRFLTRWAPQMQLRQFAVRFAAITPVCVGNDHSFSPLSAL